MLHAYLCNLSILMSILVMTNHQLNSSKTLNGLAAHIIDVSTKKKYTAENMAPINESRQTQAAIK